MNYFFFSSRRRHTRLQGDWSSDVCSSDLGAALADAVRAKRIAGAAIDVFAVEPLPADSPLRQLPGVILTPHLAASTAEAQERVSLEVCSAVREALLAGDLSFALNVPGLSGDLLRRLGPLLDQIGRAHV